MKNAKEQLFGNKKYERDDADLLPDPALCVKVLQFVVGPTHRVLYQDTRPTQKCSERIQERTRLRYKYSSLYTVSCSGD